MFYFNGVIIPLDHGKCYGSYEIKNIVLNVFICLFYSAAFYVLRKDPTAVAFTDKTFILWFKILF